MSGGGPDRVRGCHCPRSRGLLKVAFGRSRPAATPPSVRTIPPLPPLVRHPAHPNLPGRSGCPKPGNGSQVSQVSLDRLPPRRLNDEYPVCRQLTGSSPMPVGFWAFETLETAPSPTYAWDEPTLGQPQRPMSLGVRSRWPVAPRPRRAGRAGESHHRPHPSARQWPSPGAAEFANQSPILRVLGHGGHAG